MRHDATSAECLVFTTRTGVLAAAGHDLKLRVERFEIDVGEDRVTAWFDAASLRVVCAVRGGVDDPAALSPRDAHEIERACAREVLEATRHPRIEFASTSVARDGDRARIAGTLTLHGRARPISLDARRDAGRWIAEARIHQPDFGIRPYTAMLGALRVAEHVRVRVTLPA